MKCNSQILFSLIFLSICLNTSSVISKYSKSESDSDSYILACGASGAGSDSDGRNRQPDAKYTSSSEFDWHRYCESAVSALVSDEAVYGDLVQGFGQALQGGFKLIWKQPNGACQSCEASGGFCGYNNGLHRNFFCICANKRHSTNCYGQGALTTVRPEPHYIYVAIGALIFGGSVIAATVFYFTQKKKVGSYKPV